MKQKFLSITCDPQSVAGMRETCDVQGYDLTHMAATESIGFGARITVVLAFRLRDEKPVAAAPAPVLRKAVRR